MLLLTKKDEYTTFVIESNRDVNFYWLSLIFAVVRVLIEFVLMVTKTNNLDLKRIKTLFSLGRLRFFLNFLVGKYQNRKNQVQFV